MPSSFLDRALSDVPAFLIDLFGFPREKDIHDSPYEDVLEPDEFPDAVELECIVEKHELYNEDGKAFTDENENSEFEVVIPLHLNGRKQQQTHAYWLQRILRSFDDCAVFEGERLERLIGNTTDEWMKADRPRKVAVKRIQKPTNDCPIPREIKALQFLHHHIEALHVNPDTNKNMRKMEDGMMQHNVLISSEILNDCNFLYIVMPFCEKGELLEEKPFTEEVAKYWSNQILNGVETLHTAEIFHRNLSIENIVVHDDTAIIVDFEMSLKIPYLEKDLERHRCFISSASEDDPLTDQWTYNMAPEICGGCENVDAHAVDIWALGPILYTMVVGSRPWEIPHKQDLHFNLLTSKEHAQTFLNSLQLSPELKDLLASMFTLNPKDRLSLSEIRNHAWMKGDIRPPRGWIKTASRYHALWGLVKQETIPIDEAVASVLVNGISISFPKSRTILNSVVKKSFDLILHVARNGVGEGIHSTGLIVIIGSQADFENEQFGYCCSKHIFHYKEITVDKWCSKKEDILLFFIADGAMFINGETGKILGVRFIVQLDTTEADHKGRGTAHIHASAAGMYGCLVIKCSVDDCLTDGKGKGCLQIFSGTKDYLEVPIPKA